MGEVARVRFQLRQLTVAYHAAGKQAEGKQRYQNLDIQVAPQVRANGVGHAAQGDG